MTNIAEWIAMGVVVVAATGFLSYLVWVKALALGHPRRDIWRGLIMLWLCLVAAIVVLAGARALLGGPILSYSASAGGLHLSWGKPGGIFTTLAAIFLVGVLLFVALRNTRRLQEPPESDLALQSYDHHCNNPLDTGGGYGRFLGVRFTD